MKEATRKARVLIEALPYIIRFRDCYTVVKHGGSIMRNDRLSRAVLQDIVFMATVGMKVCLVHGGGPRINDALAEKKIPTRFVSGMRYTDERSLAVIDQVIRGVNRDIAEMIGELGGRVVPVMPESRLVRARRLAVAGEDLGLVGAVSGLDVPRLREICAGGAIPLIPPLAFDDQGCLYNINADLVASRLAGLLEAEKLVFLTDQPGIMRDSEDRESLISQLRPAQAESLIAGGIISSGMIPKVRAGLEAMAAGVGNVHLVGGHIQHALLLEIFTRQGAGTQIVPEEAAAAARPRGDHDE